MEDMKTKEEVLRREGIEGQGSHKWHECKKETTEGRRDTRWRRGGKSQGEGKKNKNKFYFLKKIP